MQRLSASTLARNCTRLSWLGAFPPLLLTRSAGVTVSKAYTKNESNLILSGSSSVSMSKPFTTAVLTSSGSGTPQIISEGTAVEQIETPALLLDMDAFGRNIKRMDTSVGTLGGGTVKLRPHAKSHKSAALAQQQCSLPHTAGICVSKLSEVESMLRGGVKNILLTNEIVSLAKIERLVALSKECDFFAVCCDNKQNCSDLNAAVRRIQMDHDDAGSNSSSISSSSHNIRKDEQLCVYIEIECGQGRCGVEPGQACADLAEYIKVECPYLRIGGLQCYSGWNQHVQDVASRTERTRQVVDKAGASLEAILERSIMTRHEVEQLQITGGGTGTWRLEGSLPFNSPQLQYIHAKRQSAFTELQPGSYAFMDVEYGSTEPCDAGTTTTTTTTTTDGCATSATAKTSGGGHYENALFVHTTIMSDASTHPRWVVVDAGDKAVHPGAACVKVHGYPLLTYRRGGDEHGIVEGPAEVLSSEAFRLGRTLRLVPGHCDPTINFYDQFHGFTEHGGFSEHISIDARGPGL